MSDFFDAEEYQDNLLDLKESSLAIRKAVMVEFVEKWGEHKVNVPITYIDFDSITYDVLEEFPDLLSDDTVPLEATEELTESLNAFTEPFVDYINMMRRIRWEQEVGAYLKVGLLNYGMDDDGDLRYIVDFNNNDVDLVSASLMQEAVVAHGRFSEGSKR